MKYFAYGSNCSDKVMRKKEVTVSHRQRAVLHGYRLRFNKIAFRESLPEGIAFANIEADEEGFVEGILYELPDEAMDRLDESERYPDHYDRISVTVEADGADHVDAFAAGVGDQTPGLFHNFLKDLGLHAIYSGTHQGKKLWLHQRLDGFLDDSAGGLLDQRLKRFAG